MTRGCSLIGISVTVVLSIFSCALWTSGCLLWRNVHLDFCHFFYWVDCFFDHELWGLPCGSAGKESACNAGDLGLIPGWENPLEKGKATHSSIAAWRIPWVV